MLPQCRVVTHGLDLGRWFAQPCIIVVGRLDESAESGAGESPVPLAVDGVLAPTSGTTIVPVDLSPSGQPAAVPRGRTFDRTRWRDRRSEYGCAPASRTRRARSPLELIARTPHCTARFLE